MISQQDWLLSELLEFYKNKDYLEIVKRIINREFVIQKSKKISIRIVNWFVTNYAKQYFTVYEIPNKMQSSSKIQSSDKVQSSSKMPSSEKVQSSSKMPSSEKVQSEDYLKTERFLVWTRFRSAEEGYSKEMFDPYCRKDRIIIPYDETTKIMTTIGQLNFFKWAILNKVIDYIIEHYDEITNDMFVRLTLKNKSAIHDELNGSVSNEAAGKTRKKREELSVSACRSIRKEFLPVQITF